MDAAISTESVMMNTMEEGQNTKGQTCKQDVTTMWKFQAPPETPSPMKELRTSPTSAASVSDIGQSVSRAAEGACGRKSPECTCCVPSVATQRGYNPSWWE